MDIGFRYFVFHTLFIIALSVSFRPSVVYTHADIFNVFEDVISGFPSRLSRRHCRQAISVRLPRLPSPLAISRATASATLSD